MGGKCYESSCILYFMHVILLTDDKANILTPESKAVHDDML